MTPLELPASTAEALERLAAELGLPPADVVLRCITLVSTLRALMWLRGPMGERGMP